MRRGKNRKRDSVGRPKGARDKAAHPPPTWRDLLENEYAFAEYALQRANEALDVLVHIMNNSGSDAVRMSAAKKIVRRAFGKAAGHFDVTAIKHTDIVYRTVEEIRAEMRRRGLPPALIDKS